MRLWGPCTGRPTAGVQVMPDLASLPTEAIADPPCQTPVYCFDVGANGPGTR